MRRAGLCEQSSPSRAERMVGPKLSVDDLSDLGSRLTLPQGWMFYTRVLEAECELVSDGNAVVTQDALANT